MIIKIDESIKSRFKYEKVIKNIISLVPPKDLIGLESISICKHEPQFSKNNKLNCQAFYTRNEFNKGLIVIILDNIVNNTIPEFVFEIYREIGGFLLSEIIFHEIGHHVHNKRHGIKKGKHEKFADQYSEAGAHKYFKSRANNILLSYKLASYSFFFFDKKARQIFRESREELINKILNNKKTVVFP